LFFADRPWSLESARLAEAFAVFFRPFELLFLRVVFDGTTNAWNRHAPVLGFSGEPDRATNSRRSAPTRSNVPKIAHLPEKSMICDPKASAGRRQAITNAAQG
jgi:hypothetical protein